MRDRIPAPLIVTSRREEYYVWFPTCSHIVRE